MTGAIGQSGGSRRHFASGKQVGYWNCRARRGERRDRRGWAEVLDGSVDAAGRGICRGLGLAMHFEDTIDEIHDPVITQASSSIKATLDPAVEPQARIGDLYNQGSRGGVTGDIVAGPACDDGHVRLGFRVIVEGQRRMQSRMPPRAEC